MSKHFDVRLTSRAEKQLRKLDSKTQTRLLKALGLLRTHPIPPAARSLKGHPGYVRIRVGDYRIVYMVLGKELLVLVLAVGHRRDIYERLG